MLRHSYRNQGGKSSLIPAETTSAPPPIAKPLRPRKFKTMRTITALILREMESTYGRSPGGYIWAVLEPVGAITLFTLVISFGLSLRSPSIGTSFMLFYATGFLPFSFYNATVNKTANALNYSRRLLQYPGVRYTDAILARFLLNFLTHLMVFYIVMTGIHFLFDVGTILNIPAILLSLLLAALLGLGIGVINCYLSAVFPVWDQAWSILNRPMFLLSTIFFVFEDVPWQFQGVLWYNPLIHIIGLMRRGFYPTYDAAYVSVSYVLAVSLIPLALGLVVLNRYSREILNR